MAKKEECLQCTKIRHSAYGLKCSFYGRQPEFDETSCSHYDGLQIETVKKEPPVEIPTQETKTEVQEERRCPYCGEVIAAAAIKCKHCGEWLTDDEAESDKEYEEKKPKGYILGALAGGVAAGILCTWLWTVIVEYTNFEHSYYAIAVGAIIGFSVRWVGRGETFLFGIIAAICSVVSCFLGEYLSYIEIDAVSIGFYIAAAAEGYAIAINQKSDEDDD